MRKFTKLTIVNKEKHKKIINKLGVDIFSDDFTYEYFNEVLNNSSAIISALLLKQKDFFSGIGNYIKNEVLYIAKIHPKQKSDILNKKLTKKLFDAIRHVSYSTLHRWLEDENLKMPRKISKNKPKKISVPYRFKVYGKDRDPQGKKVTEEKIAGRRTFYVKSRQKLIK